MKVSTLVKRQERLLSVYEKALTNIVKGGGMCEGGVKEGCPICIAEAALSKKPVDLEPLTAAVWGVVATLPKIRI